MAKAPESSYPVTLDIDYPERLNRLTTAFRIILILPILGILLLISGPHWSGGGYHHYRHLGTFPLLAGGIIFRTYSPHDLVQVEVSQMVV